MSHLKIKKFYTSLILLAAFLMWTIAVTVIDVKPIGPENSKVGFAAINGLVHDLAGINFHLYTVTDWLSLIPLGIMFGFALLGLTQWLRRKSLFAVDLNILALGVFYVVVFSAYAFFELCPINYRPVLINGILEASYPSSTTLLVLTVMPTAILQLKSRVADQTLMRVIEVIMKGFTAFMVIGRFLSGVHWVTDIIGGILLSAGLVMMYDSALFYRRS